jgi:hypothetical protein
LFGTGAVDTFEHRFQGRSMNKVEKSRDLSVATQIWNFIEAHHQDFGVGLFVLPVLVFVVAAAGIAQAAAWLLR